MKIYNEPRIKILALSPADVLQTSANDPVAAEINEWDAGGELPGLKQTV